MKRRNIFRLMVALTLIATLVALSALSVTAAADTVTATTTTSSVLVDGKSVTFDAYNINGNNYFKLRLA